LISFFLVPSPHNGRFSPFFFLARSALNEILCFFYPPNFFVNCGALLAKFVDVPSPQTTLFVPGHSLAALRESAFFFGLRSRCAVSSLFCKFPYHHSHPLFPPNNFALPFACQLENLIAQCLKRGKVILFATDFLSFLFLFHPSYS